MLDHRTRDPEMPALFVAIERRAGFAAGAPG
jgi:hypothetical protein